MAGTVAADVLMDGAGNSTAMDNAIYGSAKAWVNYNGSSTTIRASYNVSSITRNAAGNYTINFTNAFSDANYCAVGMTGNTSSYGQVLDIYGAQAAPTTTTLSICTNNTSSLFDVSYINVAIFR